MPHAVHVGTVAEPLPTKSRVRKPLKTSAQLTPESIFAASAMPARSAPGRLPLLTGEISLLFVRRLEVGAQFRHSVLSLAGPYGLRAQLFGELVGVHGVLVRLFAEFVSG